MPKDTELRRRERKAVDQDIQVRDTVHQEDLGRVVNLHEEGFMLIGNEKVRKDCVYQLSFQFAHAIDEKQGLSIGAECLWIKEMDSGSQYWAGFHIIDVSESDLQTLRHLV